MPLPHLSELRESGAPPPRTIIGKYIRTLCSASSWLSTHLFLKTDQSQVTCIDPRCVPEKFFNLDHGGERQWIDHVWIKLTPPTEVIVSRNAGGHVRKALQDINLLDTLFKIDEIAIIHHTDCGTTHVNDEGVRTSMKTFVDKDHWDELDKMDFGEISE